MKMKFALIALLFCSATLLQGCEKNPENQPAPPSEKAVQTFNEMYPDAQNILWSNEGRYSVARFTLPERTGYATDYTCAWYTSHSGEWERSETDILYENLPEAVRKAFEAGKYADWRIDDIEMIEYPEMQVNYLIEVEKLEREVELTYSETGELLREETDNEIEDNEDYVPGQNPSIEEFIAQRYPGARIEEIDMEDGYIIAEILHEKMEKDVFFGQDNVWIRTEIDIRYKSLPEAVKAAYNASEYASWRVEDTEMWELADNTVNFVLEIEKNDVEFTMYFTQEGQLLKVEDEFGKEIEDDQPDCGGFSEIEQFISGKYPGAKIREIEREDGHIVAEISYDRHEMEVHFANDFSWIYTEAEIRYKELPDAVRNTLKATYPDGRIDEAEQIEKPDTIYYIVEIEVYDNDFEVVILPDGTIVK